MARDHGFHPVRITRVILEADTHTRTYVLDSPFTYWAGQLLRSQSGRPRRQSLTDSWPAVFQLGRPSLPEGHPGETAAGICMSAHLATEEMMWPEPLGVPCRW